MPLLQQVVKLSARRQLEHEVDAALVVKEAGAALAGEVHVAELPGAQPLPHVEVPEGEGRGRDLRRRGSRRLLLCIARLLVWCEGRGVRARWGVLLGALCTGTSRQQRGTLRGEHGSQGRARGPCCT